MIVQCIGGLCNRLRVLLSYRAAGATRFVWKPDEEICRAHFLDVFEPIEGVTWVDGEADLTTFDPCPHAPSNWQTAYRELQLLDGFMVGYMKERRPYSAIHVRRTDHVGLARSVGRYTSDDDFRAWLKVAPGPVYIATDNRASQLGFSDYVRTLGKEAIVQSAIEPSEAQRHTSLHHAAVDLFVCAGAAHFMGSGESSFSNLVTLLRRTPGWWS